MGGRTAEPERRGESRDPFSWERSTDPAVGRHARFRQRRQMSARWRSTLLVGWSLLCFVAMVRGGGRSWHFFAQGGALLLDGPAAHAGGLHLYANYPQLQIGPVALVVAALLHPLGPHGGQFVAELGMTLLGPTIVEVVRRVAVTARARVVSHSYRFDGTTLVGGFAFLVIWTVLSVHYAHLDDALALTLGALAMRSLTEGRPVVAGIYVGLATDAKPWALVFLALVYAAPRQARRPALLAAILVIMVAWLPFVIADPGTVTAAGYTIPNEPSSALRALGVSSPRTPSWDRPVQLVVGWLLALAAIRGGRWPAVLLLAMGARIALDPGVYGYYTAGIMLGALFWDLAGATRPLPVWSLISLVALAAPPAITSDPTVLSWLRLALVLAFTVVLLAPYRGGRMYTPPPSAGPWRDLRRLGARRPRVRSRGAPPTDDQRADPPRGAPTMRTAGASDTTVLRFDPGNGPDRSTVSRRQTYLTRGEA